MEPAVTTERIDAVADALPGELAWARLGRRLLVLVAAIAAAAAIVALLPGLGAVRRSLAGARPEWLLLAAVLEVLSCLSYVLVFRAVFCDRMSWRASYEIGAAELATNSLVNGRRRGRPGARRLDPAPRRHAGRPGRAAHRRVLPRHEPRERRRARPRRRRPRDGLLHGAPEPVMGWAPAAVGVTAIAAALALPHVARALAARVGARR